MSRIIVIASVMFSLEERFFDVTLHRGSDFKFRGDFVGGEGRTHVFGVCGLRFWNDLVAGVYGCSIPSPNQIFD
jgi:hypothetical protein